MRIGIDGRAAKWYRGTGIGTYTYQLINCLNKIDNINNYLLFMPENCEADLSFKDNFHLNNISEGNNNSFWDEVNIPNILKGSDIELYHVPQNGVGLPENKECNFMITLHDVIPYKMPETVSDRYLKIFHEHIPKVVSACDGIITVSDYSKKDIMEAFNFPENKIFVTPLASEDIYKPLNRDLSKKIAKKYYSIDKDFILYVGGFSPRKNIIGLIESFSKLLSIYKKDISLVIAGKKGKSYDSYKKRAEELGISDKVIFPGFIPIEHLPYIYNAAKLFAYPSFYEGFGLPPIEAMSCGVPVVASNATSVPEVVGNGGLLINPNDVDDLCYSMFRVLLDDDLRERLILSGIVKASELSWQKTAHQTINAYNKISNGWGA
ncbi:glycosyltransferase family 4 protein [Clostridium aciditolerans]|uniref:Glycosyltransferase family 4 protein n=1 Tax=Clostridium aciditolerans TaxID=339861 RepID=A0A934M7K7_9CLOT|nr:glycosyltransferase family 1 protein [Clostridium aciditolerans]MBI6874066.1 glycosyltransferase family 4 protein [Clostridium aciditolerans]